METDLRRSLRYPFFASAEVTDMATKTSLVARTGDLSKNGCFLDMVNPLPQGTPVQVQITHNNELLTAACGVVYAQQHLGMGLSFADLDAAQRGTLDGWLNTLQNS